MDHNPVRCGAMKHRRSGALRFASKQHPLGRIFGKRYPKPFPVRSRRRRLAFDAGHDIYGDERVSIREESSTRSEATFYPTLRTPKRLQHENRRTKPAGASCFFATSRRARANTSTVVYKYAATELMRWPRPDNERRCERLERQRSRVD